MGEAELFCLHSKTVVKKDTLLKTTYIKHFRGRRRVIYDRTLLPFAVLEADYEAALLCVKTQQRNHRTVKDLLRPADVQKEQCSRQPVKTPGGGGGGGSRT